MTTVNVLEAKTNLSRLIAEVEAGGEVIIARNNRPVVRLVVIGATNNLANDSVGGVAEAAVAWQSYASIPPRRITGPPPRATGQPRVPGRLKGIVAWDERFNDPLPEDELRLWNGDGD